MGISTGIPLNWKLPLFWATVDGTKAGNVTQQQRVLLVGQMFTSAPSGSSTNAGTATPNVPVPVGSRELANQMFGRGSMLGRMMNAFMNSNTTNQIWALPITDPSAGTTASATITITAGTTSGVLTIYIAGQKVQVTVGATDTATTIATNLVTAINAAIDIPAVASSAAGVVTLTSYWKGLTANDISVVPNYLGIYGGEVYPIGLSLSMSVVQLPATANTTTSSPTLNFGANNVPTTIVAGMTVFDVTTSNTIGVVSTTSPSAGTVTLAANAAFAVTSGDNISFRSATAGQFYGGTGTPTFTSAISAIQMLEFDYVALPYADTASMTSWNTEYGFSASRRWNYSRQQYGMVVNAWRDTYANLLTWGLAQNSPVMSTMAVEQASPTPLWEWTASYNALTALGFSDDPARPLQTLEFIGILPAPLQNRFTQAQLNSLCNSGLAIQATAPDGNPMIMREQTQYQLNSFGQSDTAFGLLTIIATLQALLQRMNAAITSKYPRVKLIPDGTKIGAGQAAVTPTDIKAELISEYAAAMYDGLVSDMSDFKANLIVQIDSNDPNRLDVLWPPQLAGQLRQFDALAQFRLQYPPQATN